MKRKAKTNKYLELNKLDYDDNSQDVRLTNDTPIIARKNYKELDMFNNEQFIIKKILNLIKTILLLFQILMKIKLLIYLLIYFRGCFMLPLLLLFINHRALHLIILLRFTNGLIHYSMID